MLPSFASPKPACALAHLFNYVVVSLQSKNVNFLLSHGKGKIFFLNIIFPGLQQQLCSNFQELGSHEETLVCKYKFKLCMHKMEERGSRRGVCVTAFVIM